MCLCTGREHLLQRRLPPSSTMRWPHKASVIAARRYLSKVFVNEADGDGSVADGGCHAFDRTVPDIAGSEHAGCAGLEQEGFAPQGPPLSELRAGRVKPHRSRLTASGSHRVYGSAPMSTKSPSAGSAAASLASPH